MAGVKIDHNDHHQDDHNEPEESDQNLHHDDGRVQIGAVQAIALLLRLIREDGADDEDNDFQEEEYDSQVEEKDDRPSWLHSDDCPASAEESDGPFHDDVHERDEEEDGGKSGQVVHVLAAQGLAEVDHAPQEADEPDHTYGHRGDAREEEVIAADLPHAPARLQGRHAVLSGWVGELGLVGVVVRISDQWVGESCDCVIVGVVRDQWAGPVKL